MKFDIIDWRITSECNNECLYCYASEHFAQITEEQEKRAIENIKQLKFKAVCVSGGEPLIDPQRAIKLINSLKRNQFQIFLSTNGTNYLEYREKLERNISKLSLPLDGYDKKTCTCNGRSVKSFNEVIKILEYYNENYCKFTIKISTVLTKNNINFDYFQNLYNLLKKYSNAINVWKIYEVVPENRGAENYEILKCNEEIDAFAKKIQPIIDKEKDFNIQLISKAGRSEAYFIIRPDGNVIIPIHSNSDTEEKIIGNICEESFIHTDLKSFINPVKYEQIGEIRRTPKPFSMYVTELDKIILSVLDENPFGTYDNLVEEINKLSNNKINPSELEKHICSLWGKGIIKNIIPLLNISKINLCEYTIDFYFTSNAIQDADIIGRIIARYDNVAWCIKCIDEYNKDKIIFRVAIFVNKDNKDSEVANFINSVNNIIQSSMLCIMDSKPISMVGNRIYKQQYFTSSNDYIPADPIPPNNTPLLGFTDDEKLLLKLIGQLRISTENTFKAEANSLLDLILRKNKPDRFKRLIQAMHTLTGTFLQRFQLVLDPKMLGYKKYLINYAIDSANKQYFIEHRDEIVDEIEKKDVIKFISQINYAINGDWDFAVEIQARSQCAEIEQEISELLEDKLSNPDIKKDIWKIEDEYIFNHLIPIVYKKIKSYKSIKKV